MTPTSSTMIQTPLEKFLLKIEKDKASLEEPQDAAVVTSSSNDANQPILAPPQGKANPNCAAPKNDQHQEPLNQFQPPMVPPHPIFHQLPPLPPIPLPTFDGDHTKYHSFIDMFDFIVNRIPNGLKLLYLKKAMQGEAKLVIEKLPVIGDNYEIARKILEDVYGDKRRLFAILMSDLDNLTFTEKTMRSFVIQATSIFHQLMRIDPGSDNSTLAYLIIKKLPTRYIEKLYTEDNRWVRGDKVYKASEVLRLVYGYVRTDELVQTISEGNNSKNPRYNDQENKKTTTEQSKHPTIQALPPSRPCAFCTSRTDVHYPEECPTFKTPTDRKKQAINLGLCFKCLRPGHGIHQCRSVGACFHCRGKHHSSVCAMKDQVNRPKNRKF